MSVFHVSMARSIVVDLNSKESRSDPVLSYGSTIWYVLLLDIIDRSKSTVNHLAQPWRRDAFLDSFLCVVILMMLMLVFRSNIYNPCHGFVILALYLNM